MITQRIAFAGALIAVLGGCASSDQDEIQAWMTQQRAQTRPKVEPIPEPKTFAPQAYNQANAFDPFSNQKLTQALKREATQSTTSTALLAPELASHKEPLESFPLDSMTMVGRSIFCGSWIGPKPL